MQDSDRDFSKNVMINGTPAAKAELIIRLIYMNRPDILEQVYNAMGEREFKRVVGQA